MSAARLGLDALTVGVVLSLNRWIRILTNPLAARLFERFPAGPLVAVGLGLAVLSSAAYALPLAIVLFLGARMVWGLAWSLLRLGSLLSAIEGAPGGAGRALGEMRAIYGLGYLAGAIYAPFAVEAWGWGAASLSAAAFTLVLGLPPVLAVRAWRRLAPIPSEGPAVSIWQPRLAAVFAVAAVQYSIYAGLLAVAGGLRVAEVFPEGGALATVAVPATIVAGAYILMQRISQVVWTPIAGRLADRALPLTFLVSTLVAVAAIAGLAVVRDATAFVALGGAAFFAGITSVVAVELSLAHRSTAADRPRVLAAYNSWADVGAASGALAGGAFALAGTDLALVAGAALAAATLPLWRFGAATLPKGAPSPL